MRRKKKQKNENRELRRTEDEQGPKETEGGDELSSTDEDHELAARSYTPVDEDEDEDDNQHQLEINAGRDDPKTESQDPTTRQDLDQLGILLDLTTDSISEGGLDEGEEEEEEEYSDETEGSMSSSSEEEEDDSSEVTTQSSEDQDELETDHLHHQLFKPAATLDLLIGRSSRSETTIFESDLRAHSMTHSIRKIFSSISDARRALTHPPLWALLWEAIQELERLIIRFYSFDRLNSLGIILPILSRLFDDIDRRVIKNSTFGSKPYRRLLNRDQAKALNVLVQKWPKLWAAEMNVHFHQIILKHSDHKPIVLLNGDDRTTSELLNSLEPILLRQSRRLSLSGLGLVKVPRCLLEIGSIVDWYLGFGSIFSQNHHHSSPSEALERGWTLGTIEILDLSFNKLTGLPESLPEILPQLKFLNLSDNPIAYLPPSSMDRWSELRKIKIDRPMRRRPNADRLLQRLMTFDPSSGVRSQVERPPSLVECCLKRIKDHFDDQSKASKTPIHRHHLCRRLPNHLQRALRKGRSCRSCQRFLWPSTTRAVFQRVYLRTDHPLGFPRHRSFILGPSFFCPTCLPLHLTSRPTSTRPTLLCRCPTCTRRADRPDGDPWSTSA